ncbi:hypothetical protein FRC06_008161 [Ceratobasidium sp. 370]|nr:hypothetical protein FRC06_008161 [Ceratobasidium sp. 370]
MPANLPNNTRSVNASATEASVCAASNYSMSGDEVPSARTPSVIVPAVRVSVPLPTSPAQETDAFAGGGKKGIPSDNMNGDDKTKTGLREDTILLYDDCRNPRGQVDE